MTRPLLFLVLVLAMALATQASPNWRSPNHYWPFNDSPPSTTAADFGSSTHLSGTLSSKSIRLSSWIWPGQRFINLEGVSSSWVDFPSAVGAFGTGGFTVAFWLSTQDSNPISELLGNRNSGGHGNFFVLRLHSNGQISAEVDQDAGGTNYIGVQAPTVLNDGTWRYITVVRNGINLYIYVNGVQVASGSSTGIANINNSNTFRLGSLTAGVPTPKAQVDELKIWYGALSSNSVRSLYRSTAILQRSS